MRIFLNILLITLVVIFQVSFLNSLTQGLSLVNLPLIIIILLIFFSLNKLAWLWAGGGGILLDLFSFLHRGQITLSLLAVSASIYLLVYYIFTHRSLYSLVLLGLLGTVVYQGFIFLLDRLFYTLKLVDYEVIFSNLYLKQLGWQVLSSLVVFCLIFIIVFVLLKKRLVSMKPG